MNRLVLGHSMVRGLAGLFACMWVAALAARSDGGLASGWHEATQSLVDYDTQVHPVLAETCLPCHSQEKRSGGLSLANYRDTLEGGRSGAAVNPGSSDRSLIVRRLLGEIEPRMPMGRAPLAPEHLAVIRAWIDQGARATPTSAAARPKWEAPLALEAPPVPASPWRGWDAPLDRLVASYLAAQGVEEPAPVPDATFARRAYLDIWGLLPPPEALQAFVHDRNPDKRSRLVAALLADNTKYSEHWISFWNDLLRNEEGVNYHSENASRKTITPWLLAALNSNVPYDEMVSKLLNPVGPEDPDGFLIGVNWRGVVSASQTPAMQAAQNSAQVFLGVNIKCSSCHDSFVNKWKLKDAYALAAFFAPDPRLQLYRCDVAQSDYAQPGFLYPELNRRPPSDSLADRRATAAAIFTDPANGRLARTFVNRIWGRLFGVGLVPQPDEMDGEPWSPAVLDWLAADFVQSGYDIKRLIATILASRAYQLPAVARSSERSASIDFRGPEIRRLTAEQFADAIGSLTGEWQVHGAVRAPQASPGAQPPGAPAPGTYSRNWRVAASSLTRALGRPIRDQVYSTRETQATTLQGLELVNGRPLTRWLLRGARRMLGELPPPVKPIFIAPMLARADDKEKPRPVPFDVDISRATRLWLVVQDTGSTAIDKGEVAWYDAALVGPTGVRPLSTFRPRDTGAFQRTAASNGDAAAVRVKPPSRLVYDITARGFVRFRGAVGVETLVPLERGEHVQGWFAIYDSEPDEEWLVPPAPETPLPPGPAVKTAAEAVDRVFWHLLGRAPTEVERQIAEEALSDSGRPGRPSAEALADLIWAILMKPEFQLIF